MTDTNKTVLTKAQKEELFGRYFLKGNPDLKDISRVIEDTERAVIAKLGQPAASETGAVPAYYAAMQGNALYGLFDSEAAAQACIDKGSPSVTWSIKPLYDVPPSAHAAQPEKQAGRKNWAAIQAAVDEYLDGYDLRTDEACHTPTEFERFLLTDAVAGLLADDEFMAALAALAAAKQEVRNAAIPDDWVVAAQCLLDDAEDGDEPTLTLTARQIVDAAKPEGGE
ncbi:hypothetical protein [Bordetella genomosp. 11]|uniref:Uncharacterized protein n=1 Tax=Bordetella genomosp. 11 TaxID=1416808 RepID=A0A261UKZ8_9BORD|nr:hypothetical protein [Bordetella genomosp. 11]OZI61593.1 hypothetical protein CAL28_20130 [Bordetella genomosp. 11]